jgi:hypothetical protein
MASRPTRSGLQHITLTAPVSPLNRALQTALEQADLRGLMALPTRCGPRIVGNLFCFRWLKLVINERCFRRWGARGSNPEPTD